MKKNGLSKRIVALLCLLLLTLSVPAMAKPGKRYICTGNFVRVHATANKLGRVISHLNKGDRVIHVRVKNGWWLVRNRFGQVGFVDKHFLRRG